jgi:hypothetical protein
MMPIVSNPCSSGLAQRNAWRHRAAKSNTSPGLTGGAAFANFAATLPMWPPSTSASVPVTSRIASNRGLRGRGFFSVADFLGGFVVVGSPAAGAESGTDEATRVGKG